MGKVIATYQIRVTLREPDASPEVAPADQGTIPDAPTLTEVESLVRWALQGHFAEHDESVAPVVGSVTAERVDS